jgi:6-pyruvoyl-tetrahydropterin synthase
MKPIIKNGDYLLDPAEMDFDRAVEIHIGRFGENNIPLYRYNTTTRQNYIINFTNKKSFKVLILTSEPYTSPNIEKAEDVIALSDQYNLILTTQENIVNKCKNAVLFPYGSTWLNQSINKHIDSLGTFTEGDEIKFSNKKFNLSFLTTGRLGVEGYDTRQIIWNNRHEIKNIPTTFWSSSRCTTLENGFSNTLHDGLIPGNNKEELFFSQFSIIVESTQQKNYFSEKIIDCMLTKTVPIYFGCPNIKDFFDVGGILTFNDLNQLKQIVQSLTPQTYDTLINHVNDNFFRAKQYANFCERIENVIKEKYKPLLTVGILTIDTREEKINKLLKHLKNITPKEKEHNIQIIINKDDKKKTVGKKRNEVVQRATGKYVCFIDDDDMVSNDYFNCIIPELEKDIDGVGFYGDYYVDGNFVMKFCHANNNGGHFRQNGVQYRPLNHLNPIKTSIAKQFPFPNKNCSEDSDYCEQVLKSGLIKKETVINKVLYYYMFSGEGTEAQKLT